MKGLCGRMKAKNKIEKWIAGRKRKELKQEQGKPAFDRESQRPVIRSSICTGEQVAGFKDLRTGRFTEIMMIRDNKDMEEFTQTYGISREEIRREW